MLDLRADFPEAAIAGTLVSRRPVSWSNMIPLFLATRELGCGDRKRSGRVLLALLQAGAVDICGQP
jgi:hypothetical protein